MHALHRFFFGGFFMLQSGNRPVVGKYLVYMCSYLCWCVMIVGFLVSFWWWFVCLNVGLSSPRSCFSCWFLLCHKERYIDRELELLQECAVHPHVVGLLGVIKTTNKWVGEQTNEGLTNPGIPFGGARKAWIDHDSSFRGGQNADGLNSAFFLSEPLLPFSSVSNVYLRETWPKRRFQNEDFWVLSSFKG